MTSNPEIHVKPTLKQYGTINDHLQLVSDCALLLNCDINLHLRNNIIKLQSLAHI